MGEIRIIEDPQQQEWDNFLAKYVYGNLQQSFEYGEAARLMNPHTNVVRLFALDGDVPVGLALARYNRRFGFGDRVEVGGVYGYGPIVNDVADKEKIISELIAFLEKRARKDRVCEAFIFQPEENGVLESLGYVMEKTFNVYKVDLGESVEELWMKIAHNKRRNIKKAQNQGVEVVASDSEKDLESFYEMHALAGKRAGFIPHSFSYFGSFLKVFGVFGKAKVFLAIFEGKPVAGVFVVVHGDTAYALGAGSREEVWQVRPNDMLHWKAMEWACKNGLSYYHMGYVSEPPPTEGSDGWGLWRWKREWNGILEKVYVYHKVLMPRFRKFILTPYEKIYNWKMKLGF
jgi:CelD/BcsL family acetyltransferase involved in cellulose biosynthesis